MLFVFVMVHVASGLKAKPAAYNPQRSHAISHVTSQSMKQRGREINADIKVMVVNHHCALTWILLLYHRHQ